MNIAQYTKAASLEEAWKLKQKRSAVVLGGCCWLRLSPQRRIAQAIDLSGLGLDQIEEGDDVFRIGAMVTLGQLEGHEGLAAFTQGAMKEAVRHIVTIIGRTAHIAFITQRAGYRRSGPFHPLAAHIAYGQADNLGPGRTGADGTAHVFCVGRHGYGDDREIRFIETQ